MTEFASNLRKSVVAAWPWLVILTITTILVTQRGSFPAIVDYPAAWTVPIADWISRFAEWFVSYFRPVFRAFSAALSVLFELIQSVLVGFPWIVTISVFTLIAWQGGGRRTAILTVVALMYILISGHWVEAMNTLSLVVLALPMAVCIGFALGYSSFKSERMSKIVMPTLDLMQTIPAFAYLIPILLLFGFGPVVGLIASVIFAVPPMVRNTILGFQEIPPAITESAQMSGCTRRQQFLWAELPTALPQMLLGVNQTTMAALSMVIIAAIIGGFDDIGWAVLSSMRKAQFGQSLLAGIVIVLLAIVLDRITAAYASRQLPGASHLGLRKRPFLGAVIALVIGGLAIAWLVPSLWIWPRAWVYFPAQPINTYVDEMLLTFGAEMATLKNAMLYYVLLPVKLGFERAVVPFTWGVDFTPRLKIFYWVCTILATLTAFGSLRWKSGIAIFSVMGVMYFGATGLPWLSVVLLSVFLGFSVGGYRLAIFILASTIFLLINGLWPQAMLSIYLCSVAVIICIALGGLIGTWAAGSSVFSKFIRPFNDMLQTMPQFVLLIPALMLFQVGDFTALLAIIAYAIVPMIRYTEFGLRSVPATYIDAGVVCGLSARQLFWQVRFPQAIPQILIGINQTILYALGMLVIAALVGTTGLGQAIYVALGKADAGAGIVAGLGMALIAMSIDRILQSVIGHPQSDTD